MLKWAMSSRFRSERKLQLQRLSANDFIKKIIKSNGGLLNEYYYTITFIKEYQRKRIKYVICTDISKDGMLEGPSIQLYKTIIASCSNSNSNQSIKLVASGGVSGIHDLEELKEIGCEGVIIGKALYENRISLEELERFI
jgi:phosphoribosylformimino-5-aminoimidazole carboxamide ribotide isomerase